MGATIVYRMFVAEFYIMFLVHLHFFQNLTVGLRQIFLVTLYLSCHSRAFFWTSRQIVKLAGFICSGPQFVENRDWLALAPPLTTYATEVELRSCDCQKAKNLQIFPDPKAGRTETPDIRLPILKIFKSDPWWIIWIWKILRISVP